jgi:hypothetical protein
MTNISAGVAVITFGMALCILSDHTRKGYLHSQIISVMLFAISAYNTAIAL